MQKATFSCNLPLSWVFISEKRGVRSTMPGGHYERSGAYLVTKGIESRDVRGSKGVKGEQRRRSTQHLSTSISGRGIVLVVFKTGQAPFWLSNYPLKRRPQNPWFILISSMLLMTIRADSVQLFGSWLMPLMTLTFDLDFLQVMPPCHGISAHKIWSNCLQ